MYPFKSRVIWNVKGRHAHIIAATEGQLANFPPALRKRLQRRLKRLAQAATARLVLFILLYLGSLTAAITWAAHYLGEAQEVAAGLSRVSQWTGSLSAVVLLLILLAGRRMGQLEADIVMLISLRNA